MLDQESLYSVMSLGLLWPSHVPRDYAAGCEISRSCTSHIYTTSGSRDRSIRPPHEWYNTSSLSVLFRGLLLTDSLVHLLGTFSSNRTHIFSI